MISAAAAVGVPDIAVPLDAAGPAHTSGPAQAVKDFESLFIETLLQSSGLAQSFEMQGGPEGGMAGELLVRELAQGLADQLKLNFGRSLGVEGLS